MKEDDREAQFQRDLDEMVLVRSRDFELQAKFKLKSFPHRNRVMAYLQNPDPKVFDGLKRVTNTRHYQSIFFAIFIVKRKIKQCGFTVLNELKPPKEHLSFMSIALAI